MMPNLHVPFWLDIQSYIVLDFEVLSWSFSLLRVFRLKLFQFFAKRHKGQNNWVLRVVGENTFTNAHFDKSFIQFIVHIELVKQQGHSFSRQLFGHFLLIAVIGPIVYSGQVGFNEGLDRTRKEPSICLKFNQASSGDYKHIFKEFKRC